MPDLNRWTGLGNAGPQPGAVERTGQRRTLPKDIRTQVLTGTALCQCLKTGAKGDFQGSTKTKHVVCHPAHRPTTATHQCLGMAASLDAADHNCL